MKKGETEKLSVTASEASQKAQKGGTAKSGDSTTYPTLTTKPSDLIKNNEGSINCGCSNKRDAFFEKLLNYLEKQSEVISRCCFSEKSSSVRNKRLNTDPIFSKENSPCTDNSTLGSDQIQRKEHRSEDKLSRIQKTKENECKIIVEVCTCDKDKDAVKSSASTKSFKSNTQNRSENNQIRRIADYDCSGCEKNVDNFFKLADEICQAYLKCCLMNDNLNNIPSPCSEQNVRIEDLNDMNAPRGQRRGQQGPMQGRADNRDAGGCNSLAVEVECNGDREEFIIQPCNCTRKSGRAPTQYPSRMSQDETNGNQCPKKSCIEVFEERYGTILRDLHSKLVRNNPQQGNPSQPPGGQQQYPASQQPTYPPPQQQQPAPRNQTMHQSQAPPNAPQPAQYPPYQNQPKQYQQPQPNQYQQPQPNTQYQPYPPEMPAYYGQPPDGPPPNWQGQAPQEQKASKSSHKGKNKKKI